jgi:pimeloyl-ACP methyl ester carboxylesterase
MTAFVLVHGGWHGGWCWRFVAAALRRADHDVYTPSLTGLGDRAHLARPGIDLELHIQDVVAVLEMEDLREVVLLGHSYGGMVVTGVADRCTARIIIVSSYTLTPSFPKTGSARSITSCPKEPPRFAEMVSRAVLSLRRPFRCGDSHGRSTSRSSNRAKRDIPSTLLANQSGSRTERRSRACPRASSTAHLPRPAASTGSRRSTVAIRRGSSSSSRPP